MALALVQHDCSGPCTPGEGVRPIFAEGQYTGRIARGVVHDDDRNFLLGAINHRSYDIVDLAKGPQGTRRSLVVGLARSPGESDFPLIKRVGNRLYLKDTQGYKSWSQRAFINLRADKLWDVVNQSLDSLIADYRSTLVNMYAPASLPVGINTSSIRPLRNRCREVGSAWAARFFMIIFI
ncbi:BZ3500_MvSof-1268-A1-R1_Chr2-3g05378 [Microbotryum saponariae]|uniref:BZ3500_MvSof-1268-A1-R1_Chr2-3g05378 protein n=1 Tax=Microbotryum saponariae TaxID=289078 RepID=A0A2X0M1B9_9BASI|nr:BZ3500_MvSof-1268-A1-R1_Chr2-3g05378 [Microbotryum saponariae]SDA01317.1 BZ3501_MvSof-1269-A2-R1_Chr2-2g05051 [Microbotryum saponariae]